MAALYQQQHRGCAIVCGAAPCLFDDLAKARQLRPEADILGVNFTPSLVPEITHVWTQHAVHAQAIKASVSREITVHARPRKFRGGAGIWLLPVPDHKWAFVDFRWPDLFWVSGSSGMAGALWARHGLGYDEVIMAGSPLTKGSRQYATDYVAPANPGNGQDAPGYEDVQFDEWHKKIQSHKDSGRADGIYSMSGTTMQILGYPRA